MVYSKRQGKGHDKSLNANNYYTLFSLLPIPHLLYSFTGCLVYSTLYVCSKNKELAWPVVFGRQVEIKIKTDTLVGVCLWREFENRKHLKVVSGITVIMLCGEIKLSVLFLLRL